MRGFTPLFTPYLSDMTDARDLDFLLPPDLTSAAVAQPLISRTKSISSEPFLSKYTGSDP
jgi:hypothetical protein